jgi:hypothetical protein
MLSAAESAGGSTVYYAIDWIADTLLSLESSPTRDGAAVAFTIERTGLFDDPGHTWVQVDEAKVNVTGQSALLELGDQSSLDAPISWRDSFIVNPTRDYKTDARANGRLISYRVSGDTLHAWKLSQLSLLVQKSGERG